MVKHVYAYTTEEDLDEKQETVSYSYDLSGNVVNVNFNGEDYYYLRNAQNDVVERLDSTGASKVLCIR